MNYETTEGKIMKILNSNNDFSTVIPLYTEATRSLSGMDFNSIDNMISDKWGKDTLNTIKRISDINNSR